MKPSDMHRSAMLVAIIFIILLLASSGNSEEYFQAQAAIGIKTAASGGRYTISQVTEIAGKNGIDVVIMADAFLNRWQYGLWPLRSVIQKTEQTESVSSHGIGRYLAEIKAAQQNNPSMIIVGGLEAAPFYYWEGNPFRSNFAIKDWHKHLLVIGLEDKKDYRRLPVIGNSAALVKSFGMKSFLCLLLPSTLLIAAWFCMRAGRRAEKGVYERRLGLLLEHWHYVGIFLVAAALLLFVNGYPFRDLKYDQYRGDRGALPYQNLIDYVNKHGGMTFWAHPEAKNIDRIGKVSIQTDEHTDLLLATCGYTGFAIFYEGYDIVGRPQGMWDSLLRRYCQGGCSSPPWAIGALDYEKSGSLEEYIKNLRTVLFVKEKTRAEALEALRKGRMYVAKDGNASRFRLERFTVGDAAGAAALMGEEIALAEGNPRITIKGAYIGDEAANPPLKVLLIRDGEILAIFEVEAPFDITYDDKEAISAGKHYYRVEVRSSALTLVTNPIFMTRK